MTPTRNLSCKRSGLNSASSLRDAATLAHMGKLEEALAIFRTVDDKAKCFAEAKEKSSENIFERRAIALADAAIKLRAERGKECLWISRRSRCRGAAGWSEE